MEIDGNKKVLKSTKQLWYCEKCEYTCSNQSNYNKHLLTRKHKMELHKIKSEASEATVRASFHPIKLSIGERKIPPPMPETPDSNPMPLPIINFLYAFKGLLEWDR